MRLVAAATFACLLAAPAVAAAHHRTSTFSDIAVSKGEVTWQVRVRTEDLLVPVGLPDTAPPADLDARREEAQSYVAARLAVQDGDAACARTAARVDLAADAALPTWAFTFQFACPRRVSALRLRYDLFFDLDDLHTGFAKLALDDEHLATTIFRKDTRQLAVARDVSVWQTAGDYLVLGVEHIFTGYDHLAFLTALLLAAALGRRSGPGSAPAGASVRAAVLGTLKIVSAFTLAHSITLISSALRPGGLPTFWVEPAIALSVAYVGVENCFRGRPGRRWLLVFGFGLVHGFGFASVLQEIGLPRSGLVLSLLSFNLGVELGQLTVVSLMLPLLLAVARRRPHLYERAFLLAGSGAIAIAGLIWFVARVVPR